MINEDLKFLFNLFKASSKMPLDMQQGLLRAIMSCKGFGRIANMHHVLDTSCFREAKEDK